jgi:hypothetical protein
MKLIDRVRARLDSQGIAHALIGAAALAAAGVARSTFDIDLLVVDLRVLDRDFWLDVEARGVTIEQRRGDADDPLGGVVRAAAGDDRPVDVIVGRHAWDRTAVDRAQPLSDGSRVVQPNDLILLKLYAGGTQDMWDIRQLLAVVDDQIVAAVERDVPDLPESARQLWREIR